MSHLAIGLLLLVAVLHGFFFVMESVLWTTPKVRRIFAQTEESAATTKVLALNQGCYNAGLAAMLAWAALAHHREVAQCLLVYVIAMGVVGAVTAKPTILLFQALPAVAALLALHFA